MFPIGDDNPQLNRPYTTYGLIAANALAWFLLQGFGMSEDLNTSVCHYGLIPADLFGADEYGLVKEGICGTSGSGWFGVFSSMFMHGSWMHILGNMWFLWVFGDNVEDSMGSVRFLCFYLLSGLAAAAAQVGSDPVSTIPMVGASGAIGGVMGAYLMLYPRVQVRMGVILIFIFTSFRVPAFAMLGYWIVVQLLGSFSSIGSSGGGVAFWAHVGGFVAGALLVWVFKDDELLLNHPHQGWRKQGKAADVWADPSNRE